MRRIFFIVIMLLGSQKLFAQNFLINGIITDSLSKEPLIGVNIRAGKLATRSNDKGEFRLKSNEEIDELHFTYTGYQTLILPIKATGSHTFQISMIAKSKELSTVTVSGSRFAKRVAEEIVSIEVIKPAYILNTANNSMDDALQRVPGVDVVENQVNIRGGSGWSYGAGSRVMILVDDMPILSADAADAKFDFLPLENCEQVEILKGAASALYGSSALNGVVNFRTGFARNKPKTKVMLYNGMYGNPKEKSWKWWNKQQPGFQGGYFMHAQKIGQLDMLLGAAWYSEDSYLQGDLNRRGRVNLNLRYRFKKVEGLAIGINTNLQKNKSQTFFFWQPDSNGTKYLQPYGGLDDATTTINKNNGLRVNIDPYLNYTGKRGAKHTLRSRYFRTQNDIPEKKQSSVGATIYGEYQFQKSFISDNSWLDQTNVVAGVAGNTSNVQGQLYGNHKGSNLAPYLQLEKKFGNLWTSFGARLEMNTIDSSSTEQKPVFRAGANYELGKATFLRVSYGQGYRFPSIAERFVRTSFGASQVFPNPTLKSETGWSTELGIKQGFKLGAWMGMIDIAAFWTEYKDMMEFNFGLHLPADSTITQVVDPSKYLGFKSINVGNTRINGIDISINTHGKLNQLEVQSIFGYTYMNPVQLNPDSIIMANISGETKTLKYRHRHNVKFDIEGCYRKVSLGGTLLYGSYMQNIDAVFANTKPTQNVFGQLFDLGTGLPSSITAFRNKYNKGSLILDLRIAYMLTKQVKVAFIVKNLLNTIYTERPALIAPLRNFTLQLSCDL